MKVDIRALHPKDEWFIVLIFVVRFDCLNVTEGDDLSWILILSLSCKRIQMCFGKNHPSFLPLLKVAGAFDENSFFDLVVTDV